MSTLPLLPVTTVGSWPRSDEVLRALSARRRREITAGRFLEVARSGVREAVRAQLDAGVDLVTDGEQTRDSFYSFVAEKLDGVRLMTLAEMLDVPAFAISNPTCVGEIALREPLATEDLAYLRTLSDRPV